MLIKKFQGASEQEALQLAKQELGKDVIITHIKSIKPKGIYRLFKKPVVEITAAVDEEHIYEKKNNYQQIASELKKNPYELSGGEKQRLSIARVLLKDPALLIFDEATSALDSETEQALIDALDGLYGEKTLIMVAHRLSTLFGADDKPMFNSVIVVTDRKLLDKQITDNIKAFGQSNKIVAHADCADSGSNISRITPTSPRHQTFGNQFVVISRCRNSHIGFDETRAHFINANLFITKASSKQTSSGRNGGFGNGVFAAIHRQHDGVDGTDENNRAVRQFRFRFRLCQ